MEESPKKLSAEQVWHLIETADNFLKYGHDRRAIERARKRLTEALEAAEASGLKALADQARLRLGDIEKINPSPDA